MGKKLRNLTGALERANRRLPSVLNWPGLAAVYLLRLIFGSVLGARTSRPVIALTFDDGPDPSETSRILDLLASRQVHASFFLLSNRAEERPDLVRRISAEGHEICLHGSNHHSLPRLRLSEMTKTVKGGKRRLERVSGERVRFYRPPYGHMNLRAFGVVRLSKLTPVMWSAAGHDWEELSSAHIAEKAMERLVAGGTLLLHDGYEPHPDNPMPRPSHDKVEMVTLVLDAIEKRGLTPSTVSELLAETPPRRSVWFES